MKNFKPFIILLLTLGALVEGNLLPYMVISTVKKLLVKTFGPRVQQVAFKAQEYLEKRTGNDLSLGDLAGMDVEMVRMLEPFEKHVIISNYINNRMIHANEMLTGLFDRQNASQKELNEYIGLAIILNESEAAATEVLLSVPQCLLGQDEYYFKRSSNPCRDLSLEAFTKVISRIEAVQKTIEKMKSAIQKPLAWDNHLRHVVMKLDLFSEDVLNANQQQKWAKIKEYIHNKQVH